MNEKMYDILETSLTELENGAAIESLLARYPAHAEELRPILVAALEAQKMSVPEPSREALLRGRARLMQRASELREEKIAPRRWVSPFFFRKLAISLALTLTLALSGTGLVGASSSALPGHNLYPVKRGWEDVRLFFAFDEHERKTLEEEIKKEREHEANELLLEGEQYEVELSGVLKLVNGTTYISNIPVVFPVGAQIPAAGTVLEVKGRTTDKGYVEITEFEISTEGFVPSGENDGMNPTPSLETPEPKSGNGNESIQPSEQPAGGENIQPAETNGSEIIPTPEAGSQESGATETPGKEDKGEKSSGGETGGSEAESSP